MFSALRSGSTVYVLEKGDTPILKVGQVISATSPTTYNYLSTGTIDINVRFGDETAEFKQLPAALSIANYGSTVISESKDQMCQEVENMIRESKLILDSIPHHEVVIAEGEEILKQLSPQFAQQKDLEDKINSLETKVGSMESKIDNIASMLTKVLNQ